MKQNFSPKWKASKQPRKQRKYRARAPLHIKRKIIASHLSKDLKKKYQKRAVVLKKGDTVKITRGTFKGKQGKVTKINIKKTQIYIEGIQKIKKDGTKVNAPFDNSNLIIIALNLDDKKRIGVVERKTRLKQNKTGEEK